MGNSRSARRRLGRLQSTLAQVRADQGEAPTTVTDQVPAGFVGRRNAYRCPMCDGVTVTIDVDAGVTPSNLACRASGRVDVCPGVAASMWYPQPWPEHLPEEAAWEWYRPTDAEARALSPYQAGHVRQGGLLLRLRTAGNQ